MARLKRPRDANQLAKLIVGIATGEVEDKAAPEKPKNPAAVALSQLGASKGGHARAKKLSHDQRIQIARRAAVVRWGSKPKPKPKS